MRFYRPRLTKTTKNALTYGSQHVNTSVKTLYYMILTVQTRTVDIVDIMECPHTLCMRLREMCDLCINSISKHTQ